MSIFGAIGGANGRWPCRHARTAPRSFLHVSNLEGSTKRCHRRERSERVGAERCARDCGVLVTVAALWRGQELACQRRHVRRRPAAARVGRQRRRLARTNYDLSNTRATTQTPINSQTVSKLKLKWRFAFKGSSGFGAFASTPIVLNGTVYLQDLNSNVYALDRSTGKLEWKHAFNKPSVGPNGVAYGYGRVYGATSTSAFALDPHTGKLLWSRKLIRNRNEGIDMTPQLYDNTVVFSTVPGNASSFYKGNGDGIVWALDVATGSRSGSSTPSPTAPSCGATQRSTAAAGSGTRPRSTARDGSSSRSPTRRRSMERRSTRTARAGLAPTSTPTRSSPSTGRPERCSGTSRLSATTCATTT